MWCRPSRASRLPGLTLVCPDSHTCTVGGLGALAWGIGSTEGEHAIATQTLVRPTMREMRMRFDGALAPGVSAKDMALAMIARFGSTGGDGHVIEYAGEAIRALNIEGRLTLCNLTVEFGAWTGLVAPDEKTIQWDRRSSHSRRLATNWDRAEAHWRTLVTEEGAAFDTEHAIDCATLAPQVTWGTNPEMGGGIDAVVPDPANAGAGRDNLVRALDYMDLKPGQQLEGTKIDAAFIGSCTNSRLPDLREAAAILKGRKVAPGVKALVVPGSTQVKRDAEAEGAGSRVQGGRLRVARIGVFAVLLCRRRQFWRGQARHQQHQSQLRRTPGRGRAHAFGQPRHRRCVGHCRGDCRPTQTHGALTWNRSFISSPPPPPLLRANIDTDIIIPSREITSPGREGYGEKAFAPWRYEAGSRKEVAEFVLNQPAYRAAKILVCGANFGCGSSREMAVWALQQFGIRVIIAPSFGAIFRNNCVRNGLLPIALPLEVFEALAVRVTCGRGHARRGFAFADDSRNRW